jgi:hypothetical protein
MLIWAGIRQQSDSNRTQLLRSQDRLFDRFVPRIRSSAELIAMNSRMPDQDNIQSIAPQRTRSTSRPCPKPFVHYEKWSFHTRGEDIALSKSVSRARRCFRHSLGRKGRQIWLFTCWHHGLACHPRIETRRAKEGCPQNQDAPATDG